MNSYTISLKNIHEFEEYVVSWFIEVASLYLLGLDARGLTSSDYKSILYQLHPAASDYLRGLKQPNICDVVPIPLTPNDDKTILNLCKAIDMLSDASRGNIVSYPIPPALSFEYTEYIREYMPKPTERFKKKNVVKITSDALAMAILGAHISQVYREGDEYAYSFVKTYHPTLVDIKKLHRMTMSIARSVTRGEGSRLALLVGTSSAIVLTLGSNLYRRLHRRDEKKSDRDESKSETLQREDERTLYTTIRIMRTGNKTMLKAYDTVDLTDLARTIGRLGVASPIYDLVSSYPHRNEQSRDKRARTLRSLIEELAKAIFIYHDRGEVSEIYRVIRTLSSEHIQELVGSLLPNWPMILYGLLNVRV